MTMFGLSLCLYMTISVCLTFDVRGELTADAVYSLLSLRFDHLKLEIVSITARMKNIDAHIDQIEMDIKSLLPTNTHVIEVSEGRNKKVELDKMIQAKETILNAFASEKLFVRNVLTEYEKQFTELRNTLLNQFKSNLDTELQELSIEFETAMNNAATEHEATVSKVNDIRNSVKNIENDLSSQSSRISAVDNRLSSLYNQVNKDRRHVAFFGTVGVHIPASDKKKIVKFQQITTNIGNAYNSSTGVFHCPVSGLYLFSCTILSDVGNQIKMPMFQNGKVIARPYTGASPSVHTSATDTAVVHANAGDEIYLSDFGGTSTYLDNQSRFVAVLLKAD